MNSVLITGCNRGLGLGMVKHLLKGEKIPSHVIATCRKPEEAKELQDLSKQFKQLHIVKLDVTQIETFDSLAAEIGNITKEHGLNLLINNAGISAKFTTLHYVKPQQLIDNFTVNTVAPIMLAKHLYPALKKASEANSAEPVGIKRAAIVNISSILGSITLNDNGGFYPYKCSKSALNQATRSMSIDLKKDNILSVCIHPGWVKTDMGGKNAPLDVETSITGLFSTLHTFRKEHSGRFFQYNGEELSW